MKGKLLFVAGAAAGYILGARAGRKRYEQIRARAERFWSDPKVQKGVDQVQGFVKDHAPDVPAAVLDTAKRVVSQVTGKTNSATTSSKSSGSATKPSTTSS